VDPEDEVAFTGSVGPDPQEAKKIAQEKKDQREEILAWKSWIFYKGPHKKFFHAI
jgi:hypothetical protein